MLPQFRKIFGEVCTVKYYLKSIRKVEEKISEPVFFIFSDDIDWVKQNFTFNKDTAAFIRLEQYRPNRLIYFSNSSVV